jgi:hypothetical protein
LCPCVQDLHGTARSLSSIFFSLNRESLTLPPWLAVAPHSLPRRSPPFERPFTAHPSKQPPSDEPSAQPPSSAARSFTKPTTPSLLEPAESLVPELHHSVESEHHHAAVPFFRRARAIPALATTPESRQLVRDPLALPAGSWRSDPPPCTVFANVQRRRRTKLLFVSLYTSIHPTFEIHRK